MPKKFGYTLDRVLPRVRQFPSNWPLISASPSLRPLAVALPIFGSCQPQRPYVEGTCTTLPCSRSGFQRSRSRSDDPHCRGLRRPQPFFSAAGLKPFGRPPLRPRPRAALRPACVRSMIRSRSNSANEAKMWNTNRPWGLALRPPTRPSRRASARRVNRAC